MRQLGEPAAFPADPRRSRMLLGITIRDRERFVEARVPGVPDLDRGRAGHPVPQPVRPGQVRAGPDPAQRRVRAHLAGHGGWRSSASRGWRGGSARSRRWCWSRGRRIPFLVVLGFSPVLWTVIIAMMVRNSLMNAGNPIFNAFAMEQVTPGGARVAVGGDERAVADRLGDRRDVVRGAPGHAGLHGRATPSTSSRSSSCTRSPRCSTGSGSGRRTAARWPRGRRWPEAAVRGPDPMSRGGHSGPDSRGPRLGPESPGHCTCGGRARNRRDRGRPLRRSLAPG